MPTPEEVKAIEDLENQNDGNQNDSNNDNPDGDKSSDELKNVIAQRDKVKDEKRTLQVELDKLKAQQKKIDDDDKAKQGKYSELISEKEKEIEDLRKQFEDANTYKEKYEALQEANKKELLSKLTKVQRAEWENEPIETIRKFVKNLPISNGVDTDNGNATDKKDVKLTDEQKKEAQVLGLSEEDYFEVQKKRKANLDLKNSQIKKV